MDDTLGKRVRRFRKALDLTQEALAERVGADKTTISKWETGKLGLRMDSLVKLAQALEVRVDELAPGVGEKTVSRGTTPDALRLIREIADATPGELRRFARVWDSLRDVDDGQA